MSFDRGCSCGKEPFEYDVCTREDCRKRGIFEKAEGDLKFVQRVLESDAPPYDRSVAAKIVRELRRSVSLDRESSSVPNHKIDMLKLHLRLDRANALAKAMLRTNYLAAGTRMFFAVIVNNMAEKEALESERVDTGILQLVVLINDPIAVPLLHGTTVLGFMLTDSMQLEVSVRTTLINSLNLANCYAASLLDVTAVRP